MLYTHEQLQDNDVMPSVSHPVYEAWVRDRERDQAEAEASSKTKASAVNVKEGEPGKPKNRTQKLMVGDLARRLKKYMEDPVAEYIVPGVSIFGCMASSSSSSSA